MFESLHTQKCHFETNNFLEMVSICTSTLIIVLYTNINYVIESHMVMFTLTQKLNINLLCLCY